MEICNFCSHKRKNLKGLKEITFLTDRRTIYIEELFNIFASELVELFSFDTGCLICCECLQHLVNCYTFVEKVKETALKSRHVLVIKQEPEEQENIVFDKNVDVEYSTQNMQSVQDSAAVTTPDLNNFRYILPKLPETQTPLGKKSTESRNFVSRLYKCLECTSAFKSYKHLRQHETECCNNTRISGIFVCKFCHLCFREESSLKEHQLQDHARQQFLCCLCNDKDFSSKGYLQRHISKVHEHKCLKYFCGECQELSVLNNKESVSLHFREVHTLEYNKTDGQDSFDDDEMDLEMHEEFLDEFLLAHANENSFQFSGCWEALDLHLSDMLQNANDEEFSQAFPCPKCFEQFKNPQPLLKHLAEYHNMPVLICRSCHKAFSSYKEFRQHKLEKCLKRHPSNEEVLAVACPYCKKTFKTSISLKQHLRIVHTHHKKHICQLCDKLFSTLDHLKKHVLSQHQNERKHICHICSKAFTRQCHLKQHLFIHSTGKTRQCSECSKMFWRKIDLLRHTEKYHASS